MMLLPGSVWHQLNDPWNSPAPDLLMIARALGNICRFNGNTNRHYSVAEHSVRVAQLVPPQHRLAALLHDAAEAYVGDMASPLRQLVPDFNAIELDHLRWLGRHFGVELSQLPVEVRRADLIMLSTELRDLLGCTPPDDYPEPLAARIGDAPAVAPWQIWLHEARKHVNA